MLILDILKARKVPYTGCDFACFWAQLLNHLQRPPQRLVVTKKRFLHWEMETNVFVKQLYDLAYRACKDLDEMPFETLFKFCGRAGSLDKNFS